MLVIKSIMSLNYRLKPHSSSKNKLVRCLLNTCFLSLSVLIDLMARLSRYIKINDALEWSSNSSLDFSINLY